MLCVSPDLLSSLQLLRTATPRQFLLIIPAQTVLRVVSRHDLASCTGGGENPQAKKKKSVTKIHKESLIVKVYYELWLKQDTGNKCDCRLWVPTVAFLLYQYALRHLIWSGVKNIQCGHTILILVRKLNQLLPFIN